MDKLKLVQIMGTVFREKMKPYELINGASFVIS